MKLDNVENLLREKYPELIIDQFLKNYKRRNFTDKKQAIKELICKANKHDINLSNMLLSEGVNVEQEDFGEKYMNLEQKKYPERNLKKKRYDEDYVASEDDLLYCDDCDEDYEGICPIHGPMLWICDKKIPKKTQDRAIKTLPAILSIGKSSMPDAGFGVWTEVFLPKGLVFGPYKGSILKDHKEAEKSGYAWKIWNGKKVHHYVEAVEKDVANWLRFVNCADREERQNLFAFQFEKKIFYKTYKPILPSSELLVWYGDEYGEDLGFIKELSFKNKPTDAESFNRHRYNTRQKFFKTLDALDMSPNTKLSNGCYEDIPTRNPSQRKSELINNSELSHGIKTNQISSFKNNRKVSQKNKCQIEGAIGERQGYLCVHTRASNGNITDNIFSNVKFPQNEKLFKCSDCKDAFRVSSHLERHISLKHNLNFSHMCPICFRGFMSEQILNEHVNLIHKTELEIIIDELLQELKQ